MALNLDATYEIQIDPVGSSRADSDGCFIQAKSPSFNSGNFIDLDPYLSGVTNTILYWKTVRSFTGAQINTAFAEAVAHFDPDDDMGITEIAFRLPTSTFCSSTTVTHAF